MAARSVLKLFTKTYSYTLNTTTLSTLPSEKYRKGHRSCSQPSKEVRLKTKGSFLHIRKLSKSLHSFRENRHKEESYEEAELEEDRASRYSFPATTELTRDTAKEFRENILPEKNEEGNPIYELAEATKSEENYYDVLGYMKQTEYEKVKRIFPHLQPNNIRPYGSTDNLHYPQSHRKKIKIVYPVTSATGSAGDKSKTRRYDAIQYKEFSSYRLQKKESTGHEEAKKFAAVENASSKHIIKKNYSTACTKPKKNVSSKFGVQIKRPKVNFSTGLARKSSTSLLRKKPKQTNKTQVETIFKSNIATIDRLTTKINKINAKSQSRENPFQSKTNENLLSKSKNNKMEGNSRRYNTYNKPADIDCSDYVTVKLSELQEECRKLKKCKPKKISFGRLPKMDPPDCPCIDDVPLKEGKPLMRLKKRFDVKEPGNICIDTGLCTTPRADDNYKIRPKTLPVIKTQDCPCEEREMTDFVIKRLPKKVIPEPPKICDPCLVQECCPPRADDTLKYKHKNLPKLSINNCPCIDDPPLKNVPLHRLKRKKVKEPPKICKDKDKCEDHERADDNLTIRRKNLPVIKSDCVCIERPPMDEGRPLQRLPRYKYVEKPRESCEKLPCADAVRADQSMKPKHKRLPGFKPRDCPCIEPEVPDAPVKLKRLKMRSVPKEKEKICPDLKKCEPRADDGMVIKPKNLPVITAKECPCVPHEILDAPPLKRLIPKPVVVPPRPCPIRECTIPRADRNMTVEKKSLPALPPGSCPCIEPEPPVDCAPLRKLKKKPIVFKRVCPVEEDCPERADEHLTVRAKRLPKLEVPDCPCIEPSPPEDIKPLQRLRKVYVPEPLRVCPKEDICDEIPRSDEDDWLYWKRVEVKPAACEEPIKSNKRSFSTMSRRYYGTSTKANTSLVQLKYDVPQMAVCEEGAKSYNVIIDIKPSAPLILTHQELEKDQKEYYEASISAKKLRRSRSEPVDCVTFIIFRSKNLRTAKPLKEGSSDACFVNHSSRFISTCSTLYEYSERSKDKLKNHTTPICECPKHDRHLQPAHPIIPEKETFITQYPPDEVIEYSGKKGRMYYRTRRDDVRTEENLEDEECIKDEEEEKICEIKDQAKKIEKPLTLWERVVNYFKARPCPSPEEFKRMRLREDAERAASKAGLCLYDPKEMLKKNEKELPKVITADSGRDDCHK